MSNFVQATRERANAGSADQDIEREQQRAPTLSVATPQRTVGDALNRSDRVQVQVRLAEALNNGARVAAQRRLAQTLQRPATPRSSAQRALPPSANLQVPANLRVGYSLGGVQAPVQLWSWRDYVPSLETTKDVASRGIGGAIGGATAAYLAAGTGSLLGGIAGIAGGAAGLLVGAPTAAAVAGLALGGYGGWQAASWLGNAVLGGGTASGLASGAATAASVTGSVLGGLAGERAATEVGNVLPGKKKSSAANVPDVGEVIYRRMQDRGENLAAYLTLAERQNMQGFIRGGTHPRTAAINALNAHFFPQVAAPNQYAADIDQNAALSTILRANPFMQRVLSGTLHATIGRVKAPDPQRGNLTFHPGVGGKKIPASAKAAREIFNEVVSADMGAHPIRNVKKNKLLDPVSSMSHSGVLNVGHPATRGVLLHELGHHLENSLSPLQIASLHNFLLARSTGYNMREVGYGRLAGLPGTGLGYDTEGPAMSGATASELALGTVGNLTLGTGFGVDDFFRGRSGDPTGGYASKVYGGTHGVHTEFLSTTIHYFDDPASAEELVAKDPLRVCLFLSLARPGDYALVRAQFDALPGIGGRTLNQRIHQIT